MYVKEKYVTFMGVVYDGGGDGRTGVVVIKSGGRERCKEGVGGR